MAKKFRFSLQSVLDHREHLREQAQIALSKDLSVVTRLQQEETDLHQELHDQELARPHKGTGELFMRSVAYIGDLKARIAAKQTQIKEAQRQVEVSRQVLIEKTRDVKALELLREKQQQEFRKNINLNETKTLDDFGTQQFLRVVMLIVAIFGLQFPQAGSLSNSPSADFGGTAVDSNQIAPSLSDSLSLGVNFLLFHQMLDTALNKVRLDASAVIPKASNNFGAQPLVGVGPNGKFRAVYLHYNREATGINPSKNSHYVTEIDPLMYSMQIIDTIGKNNYTMSTVYSGYVTAISVPITPEYYSQGNYWAAQWSNHLRRQDRGPLVRAQWTYSKPTGLEAHFLCAARGALPSSSFASIPDSCIRGTQAPTDAMSIYLRSSFAPLGVTMDTVATVTGPFRGFNASAANSKTIHVRWERLTSPTLFAVDSITVPTDAGLYHVAIAGDTLQQSVIAYTNAAGTTLTLQAYENTFVTGTATRRGTAVTATTALDIAATPSDTLDRNFNIRNISNNVFMLVYGRGGNIYYRIVNISSGSTALGNEVQINTAGAACKYPDVAVSKNYIAFSYQRMSGTNAGNPEIARFKLNGTTLSSPIRVNYSGVAPTFTTVTDNVITANVPMVNALSHIGRVSIAVDTIGKVAIGFNQERNARAVAYRDRDVFFTSGTFTSKPLTLGASAVQAGDSVRFGTFSLQGTQTSFVNFDLLRNGTLVQDPPSGPYDATSVFRYRLTLSRIDSFSSPMISRTDLTWNMQPRKPNINGLRIGTQASTYQNFNSNTVYEVINRRDSVHLYLTSYDLDKPSTLKMHIRTLSVSPRNGKPQSFSWNKDTVLTNPDNAGAFTLHYILPPFDLLADSLVLQFQSEDSAWASPSQTIIFRYRNISPVTSMRLIWKDGLGASLDSLVGNEKTVRRQMNDSALVKVFMSDANDGNGKVLFEVRDASGILRRDSSAISLPDTARFRMPLDLLDKDPAKTPSGDSLELNPDTLIITLKDPDTSLIRKLVFLPNHAPRLDSLSAIGFYQNGTYVDSLHGRWRRSDATAYLSVIPGTPVVLKSHGTDVDIVNKDSFKLQWQILLQDSLDKRIWNVAKTSSNDTIVYQFPLNPSKQRAKVVVRLTDLSGARSFDTIAVGFPRLDTMGGWKASIQYLQDSLHFILGSGRVKASRSLSIKNVGTETLNIRSIHTSRNEGSWLDYQVLWSNLSPVTDSTQISPLKKSLEIPPSGILSIRIDVDVSKEVGDKIIKDTLYLYSSDFLNSDIMIPLHVQWDDLPTLSIFTKSSLGNPPPPQLSEITDFFPIASSLVFAFSEPIQIKQIANYLKVYSRLDSTARDIPGITQMESAFPAVYDIRPFRKNGKVIASLTDTLVFTPYYRSPSDFFNTKPPPHTFLRADRIGIWVSNQIADSAGNALDLRKRRQILTAGSLDTTFQYRSDTTTLRVLSTYPENNGLLDPDEDIRIYFSKPLARRIVFGDDTLESLDLIHLQGDSNTTVHLRSRFSSRVRTDLRYIHLEQNDSTLVLRPQFKFLSDDSVEVWISPEIGSPFGQTLDGNRDGYTSWRPVEADSFAFRFVVGSSKFYTFPNPFDASKRDHVEKGSITFKNLHQIKGVKLNKDIEIRIYTVDGTLIYSTERKGNSFHYREGEARAPQFDWNVCNNHGRPVASGVYMYTIVQSGEVLKRGKVMVIR